MIKLSELSASTPLALYCAESEDLEIMTKEDFLKSDLFWVYFASRGNRISLVEQIYKQIDFHRVAELVCEDVMYDGCTEDVYANFKDSPEATAFIRSINEFFQCHPAYQEKEPVKIDVLPWGAPVFQRSEDTE